MDIGNKFSFYCLNHDEPVRMFIKAGPNRLYICPRCTLETTCHNRLSFDNAGDVIMKFSSIMTEALMNGEFPDWNGLEFDVKHIHCQILNYENRHIDVGVINGAVV